ncbi:hypothetical protein MFM001_44400 [Mycobacterium sp. MFM001]|uniref:anti-sigma factor antagonist n=1 Tax=Mycobacterium sp. MFM001 TaxID=2049453 RepID=UPI000DA4A99D|nr:anti-sigma factor antagonist [Mycobacterium sp. MFM001]GBE67978.1 hypothetical protein MFM001_44400 [Mycobacterium sp. MFM001]
METGAELDAAQPNPVMSIRSDDAAERLQTDTVRCGSGVVLYARGEVDAFTLSIWRQVLCETADAYRISGPVIVDITGLDFISASGLAALANQANACREQGNDLVVVSRAAIAHRVAAATGLDVRTAIRSSTAAALRAATSERKQDG